MLRNELFITTWRPLRNSPQAEGPLLEWNDSKDEKWAMLAKAKQTDRIKAKAEFSSSGDVKLEP
jgi:hypothetical protein